MVRRVALLVVVAGLASAVLCGRLARAVEPTQKTARVGFVALSSPSTTSAVSAFWNRMRELGYVEGQNLAIEARWAEGDYERLPAMMTDLIARKVDVIVTTATRATVAAKAATTTTPIVAVGVGDPVGNGLVASLARGAVAVDRSECRERGNARGDRFSVLNCQPSARSGTIRH